MSSAGSEEQVVESDGSPGWFLLNVLQAIYTGLWSAFWIAAALVMLILTGGRRVPLAMARHFWGPGLLKGAGATLEISGRENIDPKTPYVFVANHQSMIDIPVAFAAIPVNVRFVLKRELFYVPFIGWYAWAMGMVFIDRKQRQQAVQTLQRAASTVRDGASVIAFPEGTRSRPGEIGAFKKGVFHLAIASGVPVVPIAIHGAGKVLARDGFKVRPGKIRVAIGKPIPTQGLDADQVLNKARSEILALYQP